MIVIRIQGGLGNQMFQYAYGRSLAHRGYEVVYDSSSYEADTLRVFELDVWNVELPQIGSSDTVRLPRRFGGQGARAWLYGRRPLPRRSEKPQGFDPKWLDPPRHRYLTGYWQSERFFAEVADQIRAAFTPAKPLSSATQQTIAAMRSQPSVAVHVRRTDYLALPHLQVCDAGYQRRCVEELLKIEPSAVAFVFSDDLAWCRENLRLPCEADYIDHAEGEDAWQSIWMMSQCQHHVIPNSSFSWWGAWLNNQPNGLVYAPNCWSHDPRWNTQDVVPQRWHRRAGVATPSSKAA